MCLSHPWYLYILWWCAASISARSVLAFVTCQVGGARDHFRRHLPEYYIKLIGTTDENGRVFENVTICFRIIFTLGISMTFINLPVEWFSIGFDWTWMLLFGDIRQGIFYAMLLSFWIIFCGEHMMVGALTWACEYTILGFPPLPLSIVIYFRVCFHSAKQFPTF